MRNPTPMIRIGKIHADSSMAELDLTLGGVWDVLIFPTHGIRRTQLMNDLCLRHVMAPVYCGLSDERVNRMLSREHYDLCAAQTLIGKRVTARYFTSQ